jgi:hypothetical protein
MREIRLLLALISAKEHVVFYEALRRVSRRLHNYLSAGRTLPFESASHTAGGQTLDRRKIVRQYGAARGARGRQGLKHLEPLTKAGHGDPAGLDQKRGALAQ